MSDLDSLGEYEPIACYTEGELFFPCAVDEYVARCSLLIRADSGTPVARTLEPQVS